MKILVAPSCIKSLIFIYNFIIINNTERLENLDFIRFFDIRPEFFQYNLLLFILERKLLIKQGLLEEKVIQTPLELEEEEEMGEGEQLELREGEQLELREGEQLELREGEQLELREGEQLELRKGDNIEK
jgi:hypothetical protein